jgi:spore germination protein GerM
MKVLFAPFLFLFCATAFAQAASVKVFLVNPKLHPNNDNCDKVAATTRTIPSTSAVATAALEELFRGATAAEKSAGYESLFSADTAGVLKKVNIKSGVAYVNLRADATTKLASATSSCGRATFIAQVESTVKQFKSVKKVYYAIEDSPKAFFEWMEFDVSVCRKAIHRCSSLPFK